MNAPYIDRSQATDFLKAFALALQEPKAHPVLFQVWGPGGVGKSTLLRKLREAHLEKAIAFISFGITESIETPIALMKKLHSELDKQFQSPPILKRDLRSPQCFALEPFIKPALQFQVKLENPGYNQRKIIQSSSMVDPVSLTAGAIAQLAFEKFIESSAGKAAEKFTEGAIAKMDDLRQRIWSKLRGRPRVEAVKATVESRKQITQAEITQLAAYLQVAMDEDATFARKIQAIAHEITLMQIEDNSSMTQVNYGGTNYQTKTGADNTNFFGGTHHHDRK